MAKGDQSIPIPDIPGFLGNAKESARQVDAALRDIDKQIKKTVRDGKEVDRELLVRQQKLMQVKRSTDEILKGQKSNKAMEQFAKASKALVAGSVARDIASGNFGAHDVLRLVDEHTLSKVATVVGKAGLSKISQTLKSVAANAGPYGALAEIIYNRVTSGYTEREHAKETQETINKLTGTGQLSAAEARFFDRAIGGFQLFGDKGDTAMEALKNAQTAAGALGELSDNELNAVIRKSGINSNNSNSAATAANLRKAVENTIDRNEASLGRALTEKEREASVREGLASYLNNMPKDDADALVEKLMAAGKSKDDDRKLRLARRPTAAEIYQERETARIAEIQFQRRRSRVPEVIYD